MSGQSGGRLKLSKLNGQLTCKLCRGYFIDATTIIECLHSFCRSCIVKYLNTNKYCPICEVQVHKSKPLLNIRPDHTLQDIVYKLVPGCYQNEMRCRREFYKKNPDAQRANMPPEARGEPIESHIYSPDESLSLSLEYYKPALNESPISCTESEDEKTESPLTNKEQSLPRRYLRCPAAVTVFHLQKLIRAKYGLSNVHRVDIMYKEEPLYENYTLMDVMYIYHWRRKVPLHLSYRIFEFASKRLKLSDDNEDFKQSLSNAGISSLHFNRVQHGDALKKEWKEVQLKISETGVMSVTGITSPDSKKNEKKESFEEDQRQLDKSVDIANASKTENKGKTYKETSSTCTGITELQKISTDSQSGKHKLYSKANACNIRIEKNISTKVLQNNHESVSGDNFDPGNNETSSESSAAIKKNELISKSYKESQHKTSSGSTTNNNSTNQASGSKIDALSAKLQFHPKVGQVNNTYSKRGQKERKTILEKVLKNTETKKNIKDKSNRTSGGGIIANLSNKSQVNTSQTTSNAFCSLSSVPSVSISITSRRNASPDRVRDSSGSATGLGSARIDNSESSHQRHQRLNNISTDNENLVSIGLNVSTALSPSNSSNYAYTVQDFVNNAMRKSTPISIYTIPTFTTVKTPISNLSNNNYSISNDITNNNNNNNTTNEELCATPPLGTGKLNNSQLNSETTGCNSVVPPCPDAIPISLMKPTVRKTEIIAKGTNLNEICAKIGTSGSKINDICAKIGETSKERDKNKLEIKTRPEIPDLLKISKKTMNPNNDSFISMNIPNVPCYTPSNTSIFGPTDSKANKSIYTSSGQPTTSSLSITSQPVSNIIFKGGISAVKKLSQYKTLRDPPKTWNPTLSKNSYVASKNQAKELHQSQGFVSGFESGSGNKSGGNGNSKPIASKPAKIFKMRNVPRYLGNPASGVKPMYGVMNEGLGHSKETEQKLAKEQSPVSTVTGSHRKNCVSNISVIKTDPKTISPVASTTKSPIVSPSSYSPSTRSYQNTPFPRDICHSTNSSLSPRNSPVNIISTNPFIPSPTPNTNPRLIYSHYPPPFSESTKFTNPLIHSPVGTASPSAFHSSLPPSINKLYQRTSYMSSSSSSYGQNTASQAPTVQRSPSHSAPPKSPKTAGSSSSSNFNLIKTETQTNIDSTGNANKVNQLVDSQKSKNVPAGVASDLSKTSSPSSKVVSSCINNNPAKSSDEYSNNASNMRTSCSKIINACEDSKEEPENKDEEISSKMQSNEKTENKEVKDSLNNIPTFNENELSNNKKTLVNQVHIIESRSKIIEELNINTSETTSSNLSNHTETVNLQTDESPGLSVTEKTNEIVKDKESDSTDHSLTNDLKCDSLAKTSEQIQSKNPQTKIQENQA
ncbi:probable serine/threonine-protein kinase DDB_G0282963 isoform X1 [Aphidius gifuensis]|nr:probable serine/threonine-protein kinase DDB_G0282963 isoform X1 [Aphidius gifuensis]